MTQAPEIEKTTRRGSTPAVSAPAKAPKTAKAPRQKPQAPMPLYGGPRVDLLPPIVEVRRRRNATLRLLMLGLVDIAAIAVVASLAVWLLATAAERGLADEQARTATLLEEQSTFGDVIAVKSQLDDYDIAKMAALYADTDWARIMRELDAALPAGVAIQSESISIKGLATEPSAAPSAAEGAVVVDDPGVIEILFSASAPTFDSPTPLLNALANLTGYVSADVSAVSNAGNEGFSITGTVRLDARALGGTARTGSLDPDELTSLRDALTAVATTPPVPAPAATDTASDGAAGSTGTGE